MEKLCNKCNLTKSEDCFYKSCVNKNNTGTCKLCYKHKNLKYRLENADKLKAYEATRHKSDKRKKLSKKLHKIRYSNSDYRDKILKQNREWALNNKDKQYKRTSRWRKQNKHKVKHYTLKYKAAKLRAYIDDFDKEIQDIYKNCPSGYEVDHIVPLQGKEVCGLHVPWNLQYLTKEENKKKGNKLIEAKYGK